jgi:hypothetical protein
VTALTPVFWEIQEKHDGLYGWLSERKHLICEPIEEVQHIVRDILRTHRRLVSMAKNRSGADPWVIAHAKHIGGAVVTYETWDPRRKNIKIPEVCHDLNVECPGSVQESGICLICGDAGWPDVPAGLQL